MLDAEFSDELGALVELDAEFSDELGALVELDADGASGFDTVSLAEESVPLAWLSLGEAGASEPSQPVKKTHTIARDKRTAINFCFMKKPPLRALFLFYIIYTYFSSVNNTYFNA